MNFISDWSNLSDDAGTEVETLYQLITKGVVSGHLYLHEITDALSSSMRKSIPEKELISLFATADIQVYNSCGQAL